MAQTLQKMGDWGHTPSWQCRHEKKGKEREMKRKKMTTEDVEKMIDEALAQLPQEMSLLVTIVVEDMAGRRTEFFDTIGPAEIVDLDRLFNFHDDELVEAYCGHIPACGSQRWLWDDYDSPGSLTEAGFPFTDWDDVAHMVPKELEEKIGIVPMCGYDELTFNYVAGQYMSDHGEHDRRFYIAVDDPAQVAEVRHQLMNLKVEED